MPTSTRTKRAAGAAEGAVPAPPPEPVDTRRFFAGKPLTLDGTPYLIGDRLPNDVVLAGVRLEARIRTGHILVDHGPES